MLGWIADLFTNIFNSLFAFLAWVLDWILIVIGYLLTALFDLLKDLCFWLIGGFFEVIQILFDSLDFSFGQFSMQSFLNDIPIEVLQVISLIKIQEAIGIIIAAYLIRVALRIIPFVGSVFK